MATNSGSANPLGEQTAPVTQPPPPLSEETKSAIQEAAKNGQSEPGQDTSAAPGKKPKTEKELERERRKAEKNKKFAEKQAKAASAKPAQPKAEKKEKVIDKTTDAYEPKVIEQGRYEWWERKGLFQPQLDENGNIKPAGAFTMACPPPNVTGSLHMGHALMVALQDTMTRFYRMKGKTTLWIPGVDHAGISTQSVVEKMLWKEKKQTRHDLGRSAFVELTKEWKDRYQGSILTSLKAMAASLDWSREAYTMNSDFSAAVTEHFCRLHEEGTIYRANRLVNWCCNLNTSLSNLEVINTDIQGRTLLDVPGYDKKVEFGVLTHFYYEVDGLAERIEIATTRPETMLGDTGIAVHPDDKRYQHLVGKKAKHPFVDRLLPIVADSSVAMDFGTGAVKLTPAHDFNDYARGKQHGLEFVSILNDNGTLMDNCGEFSGLKRFDARYAVIAKLKEKGLYVKWENNPMVIPRCEKSKDIIEPVLKPQWWMKMDELAQAAVKAVENKEVTISPQSAEKNFFHWMRNIQDWCISRQLWWGHQAPAYLVELEGKPADQEDNNSWVVGRTEEQARERAAAKFPGQKFTLKRDGDVLDTWFSSGLWPFATLGWPNTENPDFQKFFPTSTLETGWDILFFWVARMIMLSLKLTGKVPFKEVYCHSLIRDSDGRKMSKSLGNVIDPLDVQKGITLDALHEKLKLGNLAENEISVATKYQKKAFPKGIPECGADALRMALVSYTTGGGDIAFDVNVIFGYRRFCNKIYQATKFVLGKLGPDFKPSASPSKTGHESLSERWILHKFNEAAKEINNAIETREFSISASTAYQYIYSQLCDVFIENSKSLLQADTPAEIQESAKQTLYTALEGGLLLIHPIMPYITEDLWQRLPRREGDKTESIMVARFPEYTASFDDAAAENAYELVLNTSKSIRSILTQYEVKEKSDLVLACYNDTSYKTVSDEVVSIKSLGGKYAGEISILGPENKTRPSGCVVSPIGADAAVYLKVSKQVALEREEKARASLAKAQDVISKAQKTMNTPGWREKARPDVRELEEKRLRDAEGEALLIEEQIRELEKLRLDA
ncbi:valyl-tRNA synthetase [Talaromyces proteolyticus]|uniref:Valine--tRNA ligase, mitochondrial n=1 Tax=Talaromyces proteolyticus TaxID=1131652 RepID=A0AAD4L013_9EURO|nr:valyl-tRNA synthetase [Talaromyces proteolyticus]KAH8700995.1 valyl-tRNA synthetase [Talaromyces proteolyticus]